MVKYSTMCFASLKLDLHPAPLVLGMLRFSEAGMLAIAGVKTTCLLVLKKRRLVGLSRVKTQGSVAVNFAGVKTTCSIAIEKSGSMQGLKPPAPQLLKNRRPRKLSRAILIFLPIG